ncbi:hypothetical protein [Paraburkholderia sediminicola]|uniref:hypothetical protein n=1 Tax=Paraburkholderia sediminicola TaxID=458836 RepID=UPI0038BD0F8E
MAAPEIKVAQSAPWLARAAGFMGNQAVQGGTQAAASTALDGGSAGDIAKAAALGGATNMVLGPAMHGVASATKPVISLMTGTGKKLAAADAAAANSVSGAPLSDAEQAMASKVAQNINLNGADANTVAGELKANAQSTVPGYQRTAAEATQDPTVQAIQQGLDKSDNNGGLAARANANSDANTQFLRGASTSDADLQAQKDAFAQSQDALAAKGNTELGAVTPQQDQAVFNTPAMQKNLARANVVAQNEGDPAIANAFSEPNNDLVAGWNGLAGNDAKTALLEGERHNVTSPMYQNVLENAAPMRVQGDLEDLLNTPIMQKAVDAVGVNKANALNDEPVIKNVMTGNNTGYQVISPADLHMAKMYLDNYMQRMGNPSDLASADRWQLSNYASIRNRLNGMLENNVHGFAAVNKEFAQRSDQIAESKFLTDPQMVNAFGKLLRQWPVHHVLVEASRMRCQLLHRFQ